LIKVRDGIGLVADKIVETVCAVGVDEAVADPFSCSHTLDGQLCSFGVQENLRFVDVCDDFKGRLYPVIINLSGLHRSNVVLSRKSQDVEGIFTGN